MKVVVVGLLLGGITLLVALNFLPEIQLEVNDIENSTDYSGVISEIPGYSLLSNVGMLTLSFGALISVLLLVVGSAIVSS